MEILPQDSSNQGATVVVGKNTDFWFEKFHERQPLLQLERGRGASGAVHTVTGLFPPRQINWRFQKFMPKVDNSLS